GGHRPRRRLADVEDAALDVPRLSRVEGRERADREGDRAARRALRGRRREDRRADDRRAPPRRDPHGARPADGRRPPLCEPAGDLRRARVRRRDPPPARMPGDRRLRALDRGDRPADPARRPAPRARDAGDVKPRPKIPLWRWGAWYSLLALALVVFYGL